MIMKKIPYIFIIFSMLSCNDYLDIVPDKTQELSLLFERKNAAYTALVTCYSHLPENDHLYETFVMATDELTTPFAKEPAGTDLMKGEQQSDNPILSLWSGYNQYDPNSQNSLFEGIRACNTLIDNIDNVLDMSLTEKLVWKSEAMFLKAYFHYLLLIKYGPVPIIDINLPISASVEEVKVKRATVDEVFNYIINTIDTAIAGLPPRVINDNNLGRIDQVIAKSIKSRVTLFYASPLFNGNSELYSTFTNNDGVHFFNQSYEQSRWELAADVAKEAIDAAVENGIEFYYFNDEPLETDKRTYQNSDFLKSIYNNRYVVTDRWNDELIWGHSRPVGSNDDWWQIQAGALLKDPNSSRVEAAWQWVSPTLRMAELYYTNNGLPIDEDITFDYNNRYDLSYVSSSQTLQAQYGQQTAKLNLNRESRFYAHLGFDRGHYRGWGYKWDLKMRKGEIHGRLANSNDYLTTGYALKKIVHPDSEGQTYNLLVDYPWPLIRLAELYLNYAESLNEAYGPTQEVYDALNLIRQRAGIPNIEESWSDPAIAKNVNKHTTKEGLRGIIHNERQIELSFEGHRYNDMRRWMTAHIDFNTPVYGWSVDATDINDYYTKIIVGQRTFLKERDYLHPIKTSELTKNSNLIQNPNW